LKKSATDNINATTGLYKSVKDMPRITTRFNKSKRTMLTALEEFLSGLSNSVTLLDDAEVIMQKTLEELSDNTES